MNYDEFVKEMEQKQHFNPYIFGFQIVGILGVTFMILSAVGFVPEQWDVTKSFTNVQAQEFDETESSYENETPVKKKYVRKPIERLSNSQPSYTNTSGNTVGLITRSQNSAGVPATVVIPKIGVNSTIGQPASANVDVLDSYLQKGAVYYPGSGTIDSGNIFLFGHSTNWAIVRNQAYKTFNNLEDLVAGDIIELYSEGEKYTYAVRTVELKKSSDAVVELTQSGAQTLTISTCHSFGAKSDRWVVEADRIS